MPYKGPNKPGLYRRWDRVLSIKDLPDSVRHSTVYQVESWWIEAIRADEDMTYIGLWFEDGRFHLWRMKRYAWELTQQRRGVSIPTV